MRCLQKKEQEEEIIVHSTGKLKLFSITKHTNYEPNGKDESNVDRSKIAAAIFELAYERLLALLTDYRKVAKITKVRLN